MNPGPRVYVGFEPPASLSVDWATHPPALAKLQGAVSTADSQEAATLVEEALPVIDGLCVGQLPSLLRDEFTQLITMLARCEATVRALRHGDRCTVLHSPCVSRPTRPGQLGEGVAMFLDADLVRVGRRRLRRIPTTPIGIARSSSCVSVHDSWRCEPIILAVGGPAERRALEPVAIRLGRASPHLTVDFSNPRDRSLPPLTSVLQIRHAFSRVPSDWFLNRSREIWEAHDWWGRKWLPWANQSLVAMSRISLREASLFREAALRGLADARVLITAKVRWARARAIVAAANELGVTTIGTQHGMYADEPSWVGIETSAFATTGASFTKILHHRGYTGKIHACGAPFFQLPTTTWDCVITLQPPDGGMRTITSTSDYERHAVCAYRTARKFLGESAAIGFRLHPRDDGDRLRRLLGDEPLVSRDASIGGSLWITVESSVMVEAMLSGAHVIAFNLNAIDNTEFPWVSKFMAETGRRIATTPEELSEALQAAAEDDPAGNTAAWREEFATRLGSDAASEIAQLALSHLTSR